MAFIVGSITTGTMTSAQKDGQGGNLIVDALNNIADAINELTVDIPPAEVQVIGVEGPPGPEGPEGPEGPQGDEGPVGTSQAGSWVPNSSTSPDEAEFVKWDIEKINTDTSTFGFTIGADHIVIKQSGTYLVTASVLSENLVAGEGGAWRLEKNGAGICTVIFVASGLTDHNSCTVITTFDAGDLLQLEDLSTTNNIFGRGAVETILSVQKLS